MGCFAWVAAPGLTGTTPYHAAHPDAPERPAYLYVSEISHTLGDCSYCYGGGHYRRGLPVFLLGKVADVVANDYGTSIPMVDTASVLQRTLELVQQQETAFICTNVQETDLCGHRENVSAYADRLRVADAWIGKIRDALGEDDILVVQADHGNDPTIGHPHHTREMVPLMIWSRRSTPKCIGTRKTLSDTGATAAEYFGMPAPQNGTSFLKLLRT